MMPDSDTDTDIDTDTDSVDTPRRDLRRQIRTTIQSADAITRSALVDSVTISAGEPSTVVENELADLERAGFVYMVGDDDPEVRLP